MKFYDINNALNDAFDEPGVVKHTVRKELLEHKQLFYFFIFFFRCLYANYLPNLEGKYSLRAKAWPNVYQYSSSINFAARRAMLLPLLSAKSK